MKNTLKILGLEIIISLFAQTSFGTLASKEIDPQKTKNNLPSIMFPSMNIDFTSSLFDTTNQKISPDSEVSFLPSTEIRSMTLPAVVTHLMVGIKNSTNGAVLVQVGWPTGFTNRVEIYQTSDLPTGNWSFARTNIFTVGFTKFEWVDESATNQMKRFYVAGNADIDDDHDGLADARELFIYKTDRFLFDTDGDGLGDGAEVNGTTDPLKKDTDGDGLHDGIEVALAESVSTNGSGGILVTIPHDGWYHATESNLRLIRLGGE